MAVHTSRNTVIGGGQGGASGDYIPTSQKGIANGVATLNENGKVPSEQLPHLTLIKCRIMMLVKFLK